VSIIIVSKIRKTFDYIIYRWLQIKWNTIIAPLVREFSMNKCIQSKSKDSTAIASSLGANNVEVNASYEPVACRALYVLLQRAVSRDCPLTGYGKIVFNQAFSRKLIDCFLNRTRAILVGFCW
jgi:hypothetical protein